MSTGLSTPIIFIVFNRPDTTRRVFDAIAAARPQTLLLIADGPRADRPGEAERCAQVRAIASAVTWPCELLTHFSDINLGCDPRIVSGLDWAFSLVEAAIILEDDCFPDPSFFPFCSELLERYRDDARVASISGTNLIQSNTHIPDSYFFSLLGGSWGWATWRSQWATLDRKVLSWPALKQARVLEQIFDDTRGRRLWNRIFTELYRAGEQSPWDYRWTYTRIFQHRLTIMPRVNLIRNIGFGPGASHTTTADRRHQPTLQQMQFPLTHPAGIVWSRHLDRILQTRLDNDIPQRIINRLRRIWTALQTTAAPLTSIVVTMRNRRQAAADRQFNS
jgi:hypothetical protein